MPIDNPQSMYIDEVPYSKLKEDVQTRILGERLAMKGHVGELCEDIGRRKMTSMCESLDL